MSDSLRLLSRLALLALVLVVVPALAVDKTNFKTCSQAGFCGRVRDGPRSQFEVVASSVVVDEARGVLTATVRNMAPPRPVATEASPDVSPDAEAAAAVVSAPMDNNARELALKLVHDGTIGRLQLREAAPLSPRYEVADVLVREFESAAAPVTVVRDAASITMRSGSGSSVRVQFAPFVVDWLDASGAVVVSANRDSQLVFEDTRTKAPAGSSVAAYEDSKNMWTESFKGSTDSKPQGPQAVALDLALPFASTLHGIPEHATTFALQNTRGVSDPYRLYNLDVFEYELNSEAALYGSVPLLWGHSAKRTSGVFWLNAAETWIDIDDAPSGGRVSRWISETGIIDVFVLFGPSVGDALAQYASLTGPSELPPLFAIGFHQCRWNYRSEDDVAGVHAGFDSNDIPVDVFWLDIEHTDGKRYFTWDNVNFPHPEKMLAELDSRGRKLVTIVDPHIKRDSNYRVYSEGRDNELFIRNKDGAEFGGFCWPGDSAWPDFLSPRVREYWAAQFRYESYRGSGRSLFVWNDMNEPSVFSGPEITMPKDALHLGGTVEHRAVHNVYGMQVHRATAEALRARETPGRRSFVLTRAFFAGSQRTAAVWTGDNAAQWSHLAASIPMLLAHSIAGIPFIGADVGGFFGDPSPTLLARWHQAAALQPFMRAHAHIDTKRREPWLFGEPYLSVIRAAIRRRYAFLPLMYTLFEESSRTLMPPMRALWFEFPEDPRTFAVETAFMLGRSVLVAPVLEEGQTSVSVFLPGRGAVWYDIDTYAAYDGDATAFIATPLEKSPAFFRGGAVVPLKLRARRSSTAMSADPYTLIVALDRGLTASGSLYIDDGATFDAQERGAFVARAFAFSNGVLTSSADSARPSPKTPFHTTERIERIIVLGAQPVAASITVGGKTSALELTRDRNGIVTVRDPRVLVSDDFSIAFTF